MLHGSATQTAGEAISYGSWDFVNRVSHVRFDILFKDFSAAVKDEYDNHIGASRELVGIIFNWGDHELLED